MPDGKASPRSTANKPGFENIDAIKFDDSIRKIRLDEATLTRNHVITDQIDPSVRTAYKMLRTRLMQRMRANGWNSLAVTSATQGDGKTLTALNLAISMAGDVNHNVCLVDLDLRHSSVSSYLGFEPGKGISDCLLSGYPVKKALVNPNIERLTILPNARQVAHSSELISTPEMQKLSQQLAADPNRIVIYDMPPILSADDALAFGPMIDAFLLVVAEGKTSRTDTMKACELLENLNVIGTLLNRSDEKTASYY